MLPVVELTVGPWIHRDLRDAGEACSVHRAARIMQENKLKAQIGYKRRYLKGDF
ncbi:MAG: hypothetical protein JKY98_09030 [Gammaproteobacteria bacterium]|nr:hypothetical protein [Gammaproteobacteria bacterium]